MMNLSNVSQYESACAPPGALRRINEALLASVAHLESDGLDYFLETIVRHAIEIVDASAGWFTLPSADETHFEIVGAVKRDMQSGKMVSIHLVERVLPVTRFPGELWRAAKAADEPFWHRLEWRHIPVKLRFIYPKGHRDALRVPIRFGGRTLGFLSLVFGPEGGRCEAGPNITRMLGQHAAVAIGMQHLRNSACEATGRAVIEAERARMAGEIHDNLAQAFLAVIVHSRAARLGDCRTDTQRLLKSLDEIESAAIAGLEEARRSVFSLRSVQLERDGLIRALERLVNSLSTNGRMKFVLVNHVGVPAVTPAVEDTIYRIVQEATQNALKHADANVVTVQLEQCGGKLRVRIEDDGDNMAHDLIQLARERGGLRGMRDRAEGCGGSLFIEACSPRGTRVDALLPFKDSLV
ncbi:sensor histidine kinase [Cupriavidus necator]|uniref:sensor histidine kinase n=1 Tax=Cupriavidus necator TaxID=106590 RepID=UPI003ED0D66D